MGRGQGRCRCVCSPPCLPATVAPLTPGHRRSTGYAVFFATFDTSRRLALHVRRLVSSVQTSAALNPVRTTDRPRVRAFFGLEDGLAARQDEEEEGALGYEGSRWARTSQAVVLVAGGMLAGQL